jgi:hypothetical protein
MLDNKPGQKTEAAEMRFIRPVVEYRARSSEHIYNKDIQIYFHN